MIKCEKGHIKVEGDGKQLLVDFAMICASMYNLLLENLGEDMALAVFDACSEVGINLHDLGESIDTSLLKQILENRGGFNGET